MPGTEIGPYPIPVLEIVLYLQKASQLQLCWAGTKETETVFHGYINHNINLINPAFLIWWSGAFSLPSLMVGDLIISKEDFQTQNRHHL